MASTGQVVIDYAKAQLCSTQSRARNGKKYHNKYTEYFKGYGGISKTGVMPRPYGYTPGHCTIGAMYCLVKTGNSEFVPYKTLKNKKTGYFWHTGAMMKYYKKKGWFTTSPSKAVVGAVAFKGTKNKKGKLSSTPTHTCLFIKTEGNYVWTVDFNVSDGKGHNNGVVKKRHKSYFLGFANLPYAKPIILTRYIVATSGSNLNVRHVGSAEGKKIASIKNGEAIEVTVVKDGWAYVPKFKGWVSTRYIKKG